MPQAVVPRDPNFFRSLNQLYGRVRRLEVNRLGEPNAGTAIYAASYSLSAGATWTPDFSGATSSQADQIGLTPYGSGVLVPPGWIVWLTIALTLSCTTPPTGESLNWSVGVGEGLGLERSDVMLNGSQIVAGMVSAPAGWENAALPVAVNAVGTAFGSSFTPSAMAISAVGIQLPTAGWPLSGPS